MLAPAWLTERSRLDDDDDEPRPPYDDLWMTTVRALTLGRYVIVGASLSADERTSVVFIVVVRCVVDSTLAICTACPHQMNTVAKYKRITNVVRLRSLAAW